MRFQWIAIPALVGGLLATTDLALAHQLQPGDGSGVPECVEKSGSECQVVKSDNCTKYTMVQIKIGTETVIKRECSERTVSEKYYYWKK